MNASTPPSQGPVDRAQLEGIWKEILGLADIDPDLTFVDLGGTSLGANQLVAKIAKRLGIEVPVIRVFEYPTFRQFFRFLAQDPSSEVEAAHAPSQSFAAADATASIEQDGAPAHLRFGQDIAIVGMACRFPGAKNVAEYWQNLLDGRESIRALSDQELSPAVSQEVRNDPRYVRAAGLIDQPYAMDAAFFDVNPMEARLTDPQQRVLLETSWEALENAGHGPGSFVGRAAVFAGTEDNSYYKTEISPFPEAEARAGRFSVMTGNEKDFAAMRIAHKLDLRGPAVSVSTACSTSLVAVVLACKSLRSRECDLALAGGATVHFPTPEGYYFQEGGVFSSDGHCRPFDQDAEGTVFTDGVGVVVLKRVEDAIRDRNTIYAVIKGGAVNNDGAAKISFSAPSIGGQASCIADALRDAGVDPGTIGYVEAHGTATPVGDPIELEGLRQAFGKHLGKRQFCGLGSAKSNIGHTTAAAGVAGLIKAALALQNDVIPASLHYRRPNPALDIENSPFYIVDRKLDWPRGAQPRRAGVSSFGIGGTNSHVVLQEAPQMAPLADAETTRPFEILPVSARTAAQRDRLSQSLGAERSALRDLAYTLQHGRTRFLHRGAAIRLPRWPHADTLVQSAQTALDDPQTVFLFPGQGSQYIGMGRSLHAEFLEFRHVFTQCCRLLSHELGLDFEAFIFDAANQETLENTRYTQPALFAIEVSLGRMLLDWGLRPSMMVGHSIGEFAAAHLAGVFSLEEGIKMIAARGRLMAELPRGKMLSARASIETVLGAAGETVDVASINSPVHSVLAGPDELIARVQQRLEAAEIPCRLLHTSHAFHSGMMTPVVEPFLELVRTVKLQPPRMRIISTVTGEPMSDAEATDPAYWARHLRATVKFSPALRRAIQEGGNLFLEVGPRTTLTSLATQHFAKDAKPGIAISALSDSPESDVELPAFATALARLWISGLELPWQRIWPAASLVPLATGYPFERKDFRFSDGRQARPRPADAVQPAVALVQSQAQPLAQPLPMSAPPGVPAARAVANVAEVLTAQLATLFGEFAGMPVEDAQATFIQAGFDSLVLMQIGVELGKRYGVSVSLGDLMKKHNTLRLLAAHLAKTAAPARLPRPAEPVPPAAGVPLPAATPVSAPVGAPAVWPRAASAATSVVPNAAEVLTAQLATLFGEFAGMPIDEADASFIQAGFDSLVLMQIGVELGKRYGVSVSLGDLMKKHNTLHLLADHLAKTAAPARLPQVPAPAVAVAPPPASLAASVAAPVAAPAAAPAAAAAAPATGGPGSTISAAPPAVGADLAQIIDAQLRQMKEIFEMQLRYASRGVQAPQAVVLPVTQGAGHGAPQGTVQAGAPSGALPVPVAAAASDSAWPSAPAQITHRPDPSGAPLTVMQERIRFLEEMHPGRVVYSVPSAHRLSGPMNPSLFAQALREVIRRQSSLRTCVGRTADGRWIQQVHEQLEFGLPFEDLSELAPEQRAQDLQERMQAIIDQPFDIQAVPLFRAALWKLDAGQHAFLFVPHHLIWDGWSFDLLFDELAAIYGALCKGQGPQLAPLAIDYGDFAHWHAQWQSSAEYAAQLVYWKGLYKRLPAPQAIATDQPRASGRSGRGGIERIRLDQDRADRLRAVARSSGGTLSMLMLAAYTALIQQMVGAEDVVIGVPVRGRRLPELEPIMGFFNNLLPLPVHVDRQQPFAAWIGTVGGMLAEAFDRQDVPFERLAAEPEAASWARQAGVPYHALISFQDARKRNRNWGGLAHEPIPVMQYTATEDFGLWVTEQADGIACRLVYDADAFTAETAALVRARLEMILTRVLERPEQTLVELTALGDSESALISTWSVVSRGARVLGADGKPVPVGIAGALWQNDQDTGKRARWRSDGTLQTLGVPEVTEATERAAAAPAAARAPVSGATALSAAEQVLAQVWSEILDVPTVRASDNFFELGGTSLQAMQAATLLEQHFGRPVSARKFVMESLRSLAHSYAAPAGVPLEADHSALATAPAVAAFGSSDAARLTQEEAASAAESGAARRKRVGQHKGGLVGRLAGVFGRGRAASTPARPSHLPTVARAAPVLHAAPPVGAVGTNGAANGATNGAADTDPARGLHERARSSGTSRLRRVRHMQPPVPGAFRGPTIDGEPAWYRLDEKTGRYEQVRP